MPLIIRNQRFLVLALVTLLMLGGCQPKTPIISAAKPEAPMEVGTAHPFTGDIVRNVTLPGIVAPNQQATLYAKVAGYLKEIKVDKGDVVKQGDLLATIEAPEILADRAKFKADLDIADIDFQRTTKAQQKAPDLIVVQSVDATRAKYLAAKANFDRAETLLSFTQIIAPFSGVVTRRSVDPGAFIPAATSGSAAQNAVILTLMDFATVRIQVGIPEPEVPLVRRGLPIQLIIDELPGRSFSGVISRYSQSLDDTRTMLTEIDIPNPKGDLLPGMYAKVRIGIEKKEKVLLVPVASLLMEKANAFVFIVLDNKAKKTPIKIGFNDGVNVEVTAGLQANDLVVVLGKQALNDGQSLKVMEAK